MRGGEQAGRQASRRMRLWREQPAASAANPGLNIRRMKKVMFSLLVAALSAAWLPATAGRIGTWTLYPSFSGIAEIEPTGRETFALASGSLFSYNPGDGELKVYDKTSSLSDNNIRHIAWSRQAKRLVIVYDNSNIDLLASDGSAVNIPDLYRKATTYDKGINHICIDGTSAYLATDFGVVKLNAAGGSIADTYQLGFKVDYCYVSGGSIYAVSQTNGTYRGDKGLNLLDRANWVWDSAYKPLSVDRTNVKDSQTGYWWTVSDTGKLAYYTLSDNGEKTFQTEGVLPDGPSSNNFYRIYISNGRLYATGGIWNEFVDGNLPGEVHIWDGSSWSELEKPSDDRYGKYWGDVLCLEFDPADADHIMAGTKNGMFEYRDGKFVKLYNRDDNPDFYSASSEGYFYTIISSVKYDGDGNLWVFNPNASPINCLTAEGRWKNYKHEMYADKFNIEGAFISETNGLMWFVNNRYKVEILYAYDYKNDKLYTFGPQLINQDGIDVSASYMYCPTEDREGNIWIGTDVGPLYLTPATIGAGETGFTQYKVPRNDGTNNADYLLSGVSTISMAVDGGNRKWFGSDGSGVFLVSADNNTQLQHFTSSNSPLPSDIINDIAVDGATGTVYFATDRGLASYQGDASEPSESMSKDNVYAYPNPVRPDYTGPITVTGLTYDADVKIVTSSGVLVNRGRSTGGMYQWDGTDLKGRRVASGIYMVETATADGGSGTVCKIAVVN